MCDKLISCLINMNDKILIWYHNEDNDGLFSAAICYSYIVHELKISKDNIVLQGMTYNLFKEQYPDYESLEVLKNTYSQIMLTDVSFNDVKQMKALKSLFGIKFTWFDHHKPIIDASIKDKFDDVPGWRDTSRSAILNAYRYLYDPLDEKYQTHTEPFLLRILSAYDSWSYEREKIKFEKARNVNKGVTTHFNLDIEKVIPFVESLLYGGIDEKKHIAKFEKLGKQLNAYDDMLAANQLKEYGDFEWHVNGRKAVMIMFQGPSGSQMFKTLQGTEIKNGIVLKYLPNGKWNISLYNVDRAGDTEIHCGNYLKENYGGGGHAGAAGAVINATQFTKIMKNKAI